MKRLLYAAVVTLVIAGGIGFRTFKGSAVSAACAGEWTRAVAAINDPGHNNTMVIRNAANLSDAVNRAHKCRADVGNVSFFEEGARLACAPYIACDAR